MIPFRDDTRSGPTPWASAALCVLVGAVFAYQVAAPVPSAVALVEALALFPAKLVSEPFSNAHTLVGSLFIHAGWGHLLANLLFLAVFAPGVEDVLGRTGLIALFTFAGVAGGLAYALAHPASTVPVIGASGAISGIMGATMLLRPRAEFRVAVLIAVVPVGVARLQAAFVLGVWLLVQLASGIGPEMPGATSQIAWTAHLAGFGAGILVALIAAVRTATARPSRARVSA